MLCIYSYTIVNKMQCVALAGLSIRSFKSYFTFRSLSKPVKQNGLE